MAAIPPAINNTINFPHNPALGATECDEIIGTSVKPTVVAGTGAGTSPTVGISAGSNVAGELDVLTGTTPAGSNATIVTVTFGNGYTFPAPPFVALTQVNAATAALVAGAQVFVNATTTGFSVKSGATALTASTQYAWNYHIVG